MEIDRDWWKKIFDNTYLITDARTVCDETLTSQEVDFLEKILNLDKSWAILDMCGGQGRHSLELSRRGFRDVTVLDFSGALIRLGKERARSEGLSIRFIENDARKIHLPNESFRIVIIMASSFGYFEDDKENARILEEAFRLLTPKGKLLLDLPNTRYVTEHLVPQAWHEANEEIVVCRQRKLRKGILYSREMVISKKSGVIRDENYCVHLYSPDKIRAMLQAAGFGSVKAHLDFVSHSTNGDYGCMNNRMIVIADKE